MAKELEDINNYALVPLDQAHVMDLLDIRRECDDQLFTPFYGNECTQNEWYKKVSTDPSQLILVMSGEGSFGIAIGIGYRGCGLGTKFTKETLNIAFNKLGMQKVWLEVFTDNKMAIHVYEKCGFKIEGTMKNQYWKNGSYKDTYRMGAFRPRSVTVREVLEDLDTLRGSPSLDDPPDGPMVWPAGPIGASDLLNPWELDPLGFLSNWGKVRVMQEEGERQVSWSDLPPGSMEVPSCGILPLYVPPDHPYHEEYRAMFLRRSDSVGPSG